MRVQTTFTENIIMSQHIYRNLISSQTIIISLTVTKHGLLPD